MVTARRVAVAQPIGSGGSIVALPAAVPAVAALGVAIVVALLVASTPIGSGDYGQWLMVSRVFSGGSTPDYRALADVPPLVPALIALIQGWLGDPMLTLHLVGFVIVIGLGTAFFAAGWALHGRPITGLIAVVLGLLVTDRYLDLLAFGGLLQAGAIVFEGFAMAAFSRAIRSSSHERRWWAAGCLALLGTCLTHVPTATIALPVGVAAAALTALPAKGERLASRAGRVLPLGIALGAIGAYWLVVIAPASLGYVANPASLAYRGPERVIDTLSAYPPTFAIVVVGLASVGAWATRHLVGHRLPSRRDTYLVLLAWLVVSWGVYLGSVLRGASTDYPRFVPLLLAPLVVCAAAGLAAVGGAMGHRAPRRLSAEGGLVAIGLGVVLVAPFSIANYQTQANGYALTDESSLAAAATWADSRLVSGAAILAPVREAKWIEGLTGRSALFSSQVRYAFRPVEWERSLAAGALLRGNVALANESFVLTMTDGVPFGAAQEPQAVVISANHGGEYVDLLRLVPQSSMLLDGSGGTLASLPGLAAAGFDDTASLDRLQSTTRWSARRLGKTITYAQTLELQAGAKSFHLDLVVDTRAALGGLQVELRPTTGVSMLGLEGQGGTADITFARIGRSEPRLRLSVDAGTITTTKAGGILISTGGPRLSLQVTDLTAGGATSSLRLLDPERLVADYNVGAAILRRDPAYDARRARLELLGFHVAHAEGPYVVMVRTGAALPAAP